LNPGGGISKSPCLSRRVVFGWPAVGTFDKGEELRECRDAVKELGRLQDEVWALKFRNRKTGVWKPRMLKHPVFPKWKRVRGESQENMK